MASRPYAPSNTLKINLDPLTAERLFKLAGVRKERAEKIAYLAIMHYLQVSADDVKAQAPEPEVEPYDWSKVAAFNPLDVKS